MINTNPRGPESNPPIINLRPRAVLPFFDFFFFLLDNQSFFDSLVFYGGIFNSGMLQSILFNLFYSNKFFFFFIKNFNLWRPLLMIAHYHQTKTLISFWCRRGLNSRSFIQPSETLPVELIGTHILFQQLKKRIWL